MIISEKEQTYRKNKNNYWLKNVFIDRFENRITLNVIDFRII